MPPIENLLRVPPIALSRLERQGIFSTGLFLEVSETRTRRTYLADQIGVYTNDIDAWRDEALLLNLANFGPEQQGILNQGGIVGLSDLLALSSQGFHDRVTAAAQALGLEPPSDLAINGWYEQAQTLAED